MVFAVLLEHVCDLENLGVCSPWCHQLYSDWTPVGGRAAGH